MSTTCDYKIMHKGKAAEKIIRNYKSLTGENVSPPVDSMFFVKDVPETQVHTKMGANIENGFHKFKAKHTLSDTVGILITVQKYSEGGMHAAHAIAAVKHGDTLFAMNAWGDRSLPMDANIFNIVKERYGCARVYIYSGESLQQGDSFGVCVGYASNFVLEMFVKILQNKLPSKISQKMYDTFVYTALKTRGICFGSRCVKNMAPRPLQFWSNMEKNLQTQQVSPQNLASTIQNKRTKLPNLYRIGRNYEIKIPSRLKKQEVVNRLTQILRKKKVANLENINFPVSPLVENLTNLKLYAKYSGIKGYNKFTTKKDLINYIRNYKTQLPSPPKLPSPRRVSPPPVSTLASLRKIAKNKGLKGYSKYTKKENLAKYIRNYKPVSPSNYIINFERQLSPTTVPTTLASLRKIAKNKGIKGYSKFTKKENLAKYIRNYKPVSPPKPKTPKVKVATLANLKKFAKNQGIKGYSKYTKKENLYKYIVNYRPISPPKPKVSVMVATATLANLKKIAKNQRIKGYTKYTKKENLAKYITDYRIFGEN